MTSAPLSIFVRNEPVEPSLAMSIWATSIRILLLNTAWGLWQNLCGQGCPGADGQSFCAWKAAWRFWKRSRNEWDGGMKGNEVCFIWTYAYIYIYTYAYIDIHTICTELFSILHPMKPSRKHASGLVYVLNFLFWGSNLRLKKLNSMFTSLLCAFEIAIRLAPEMMCDESQLSDAPTELGSSQGPGVCSTISSDSMEVCAGWHGMSPLGQSCITSRWKRSYLWFEQATIACTRCQCQSEVKRKFPFEHIQHVVETNRIQCCLGCSLDRWGKLGTWLVCTLGTIPDE